MRGMYTYCTNNAFFCRHNFDACAVCRMVTNWPKGNAERRLDGSPSAMLEMLEREDSDVCMTMAVFPQELLTLVAFPEHAAPYYSSISVTHGPVWACVVVVVVDAAQPSNETLFLPTEGYNTACLVTGRINDITFISPPSTFLHTHTYIQGEAGLTRWRSRNITFLSPLSTCTRIYIYIYTHRAK